MHPVAYADLGGARRLGAPEGGEVPQRLIPDLGRALVDLLPQRVLSSRHRQGARRVRRRVGRDVGRWRVLRHVRRRGLAAGEVALTRRLLDDRRRQGETGPGAVASGAVRAGGASSAVRAVRPCAIASGDGRRRLVAQLVDGVAEFGSAVQSGAHERGLDPAADARAEEGGPAGGPVALEGPLDQDLRDHLARTCGDEVRRPLQAVVCGQRARPVEVEAQDLAVAPQFGVVAEGERAVPEGDGDRAGRGHGAGPVAVRVRIGAVLRRVGKVRARLGVGMGGRAVGLDVDVRCVPPVGVLEVEIRAALEEVSVEAADDVLGELLEDAGEEARRRAERGGLADVAPVYGVRAAAVRGEVHHRQPDGEGGERLGERLGQRRRQVQPLEEMAQRGKNKKAAAQLGHHDLAGRGAPGEEGHRQVDGDLDEQPDDLGDDLPLGLHDVHGGLAAALGDLVELVGELAQVVLAAVVDEHAHRLRVRRGEVVRHGLADVVDRLVDQRGQPVQFAPEAGVGPTALEGEVLVGVHELLSGEDEDHGVDLGRYLDAHRRPPRRPCGQDGAAVPGRVRERPAVRRSAPAMPARAVESIGFEAAVAVLDLVDVAVTRVLHHPDVADRGVGDAHQGVPDREHGVLGGLPLLLLLRPGLLRELAVGAGPADRGCQLVEELLGHGPGERPDLLQLACQRLDALRVDVVPLSHPVSPLPRRRARPARRGSPGRAGCPRRRPAGPRDRRRAPSRARSPSTPARCCWVR
ncbi:hypothetical protein P376_5112 [Streptomyces sp. HCCB10043]|nr:hypothetical protein P376_5112 [Streptomyces sp. HCCB10043]